MSDNSTTVWLPMYKEFTEIILWPTQAVSIISTSCSIAVGGILVNQLATILLDSIIVFSHQS